MGFNKNPHVDGVYFLIQEVGYYLKLPMSDTLSLDRNQVYLMLRNTSKMLKDADKAAKKKR